MKINIISLFPEFFTEFTRIGVIGRAYQNQLWSLQLVNPRDFADNRHGNIDDRPYGGGAGMVMSYTPLYRSLLSIYPQLSHQGFKSSTPLKVQKDGLKRSKVIALSPSGKPLKQQHVEDYAKLSEMTLICGRYEGIDQRFIDGYVDEELSIGDFVLSGGEPAALCLVDAVLRLLPDVLGNKESLSEESYSKQWDGLLDYPHYTRPEEIHGQAVPSVLLQGDHKKIAQWRRQMSLQRTCERRPDLMTGELLKEYKKQSP